MQPRSDGPQRCLTFQLMVHPRARVQFYRDYLGNTVHHFDVPGRHKQLSIIADALVDVQPTPALPASLGKLAWDELDDMVAAGDYIEMLMPSHFGQSSELLEQFAQELGVDSREKSPAARSVAIGAGPQRSALFQDRLCSEEHQRGFAHRSRARKPAGRLPGLRAHHDRSGAPHRNSLPLRLGLPVPQSRRQDAFGRRRHARLGGGAPAGIGMGRIGPHQQRACKRPARADRRGARLCGRPSNPGHLSKERPTAS